MLLTALRFIAGSKPYPCPPWPNKRSRGQLPLFLLVALGLAPTAAFAEEVAPLLLGTAPVAGSFYPAGGAICREVNRQDPAGPFRCAVVPTGGSSDNLRRLKAGQIDLALVQADWVRHATAGGEEAAFSELRELFALHPLVVTVVAGPESELFELSDLDGKRIAIGPAASALSDSNRLVLEALGYPPDSVELVEISVERLTTALCNGEVDAFILPVAHPNAAVASAVDLCAARIVPVEGTPARRLKEAFPAYGTAWIPAGYYLYNSDAVESVGLKTILVATESLPEAEAYGVVKAVFENLDDLRQQYPLLGGLVADHMIESPVQAPRHEGAQRYLEEQGLL